MLVQPGVVEGVGLWRRAVLRPSERAGDLFDGLAAALLRDEALPELASDGTTPQQLAGMLRSNPEAARTWSKAPCRRRPVIFARPSPRPFSPPPGWCWYSIRWTSCSPPTTCRRAISGLKGRGLGLAKMTGRLRQGAFNRCRGCLRVRSQHAGQLPRCGTVAGQFGQGFIPQQGGRKTVEQVAGPLAGPQHGPPPESPRPRPRPAARAWAVCLPGPGGLPQPLTPSTSEKGILTFQEMPLRF